MMERRKVAMTGIGTIMMAGVAYMAWKKSVSHRTKYKSNLRAWKKNKIADVYYKSLDERDIAWG